MICSRFQNLQADIVSHKEPVARTVQDVSHFLEQLGHRLAQNDRSNLQDTADRLQSRYDVVDRETNQRLSKVSYAADDLGKFDREGNTFDDWLGDAERQLVQSQRSVPTDVQQLDSELKKQQEFAENISDHKGDLKFINMTGTKFEENAKVRSSFIIGLACCYDNCLMLS